MGYPITSEVWDPKEFIDYSNLIEKILKLLDGKTSIKILAPGVGKGRVVRNLLENLENKGDVELVIIEPNDDLLECFTQWLEQKGFEQQDENKNGPTKLSQPRSQERGDEFPGSLSGDFVRRSKYVKSGIKSGIQVFIFRETIEEYLKREYSCRKCSDEGVFDIVLCFLFLHYVPYGWVSILRTMYDLLKPDGSFIVDQICGQDQQDQELLEVIDCDAHQLEKMDRPNDECLQWRTFYLNRLFEEGAYWGSTIKGTNIKLVIEALKPLFAEYQVVSGGAGDYPLQRDHLPWWWASEQTSNSKPSLPSLRPLRVQFKFHVFHRKHCFSNPAALESHWNLVKKACILTAAQNFGAVLWFLQREKSFSFQDSERFVQDILPSIVLQLVASSGIIDYRHDISSIFISSGTLPSELGLPKLQKLFLLVSDVGNKGEGRIQAWLRNYIIYADILKAPLSETFIPYGKRVLLYRESKYDQNQINMFNTFGYEAIPVPCAGGGPDLSQISPPTVKQLLWWKLLQIDLQRGVNIEQNIREKLEEFVEKVKEEAGDRAVPGFPDVPYSHVRPLSLLMRDLGDILFIPIPTFFEYYHDNAQRRFQVCSIMGIGVTVAKHLSDEEILISVEDIYTLVALLFRRLQDNYLSLRWVDNFRRASLRSAVAAIMARNMSHVLGSHIEPGIQNDMPSFIREVANCSLFEKKYAYSNDLKNDKKYAYSNDLKNDLERLLEKISHPSGGWPLAFRDNRDQYDTLNILWQVQEKARERYAIYRQRRMDFIARVATDWPAWGAGFDFYFNFVRPFLANSLLLHFIGYSDQVPINHIAFDVAIADTSVTEWDSSQGIGPLGPADLAFSISAGLPTTIEGFKPITVWARGAEMAVQAFHILLENIIRNSIKHRSERIRENQCLKIIIRLFESYDGFKKEVAGNSCRLKEKDDLMYIMLISDADDPLMAEDMDEKLCQPIIKEGTGEREPENWGMKEMKIAAAFLANEKMDESNSSEPHFIQAIQAKLRNNSYLAFCIVIPRFYYAGIFETMGASHGKTQ